MPLEPAVPAGWPLACLFDCYYCKAKTKYKIVMRVILKKKITPVASRLLLLRLKAEQPTNNDNNNNKSKKGGSDMTTKQTRTFISNPHTACANCLRWGSNSSSYLSVYSRMFSTIAACVISIG